MLNTRRKWENTTILMLFVFITFIDYYFSTILYAGGQSAFTTSINTTDSLRNPSRRYAATFERDNIAYIWGGEGTHSTGFFRDVVPYFSSVSFDTIELTLSYDFVPNSRDYKNFSAGGAAVVDPTNSDRVLFFGGYRESRINASEDVPLYIEQYDFSNSQWSSIVPAVAQSQENESTAIAPPRNRAYASAIVASDGNIYIAGGKLTNVNGTSDSVIIWRYDPFHQTFTPAISQKKNTTVRGESLNNIHAFTQNQQILYITGVNQLVCLFDPTKNSLLEQETFGGVGLTFKNISLSYGTSFQGTYGSCKRILKINSD